MTPTLFANFHDEAQTMAKISHSEEHSGHKYYAPEPPALHYLRSAYSNLIGPQVLISATLLPTLVEPLWGLVVGAGVAGRHLDGQHLDGHRRWHLGEHFGSMCSLRQCRGNRYKAVVNAWPAWVVGVWIRVLPCGRTGALPAGG
eukprot:6659482-Prymnesium_polylepis.1